MNVKDVNDVNGVMFPESRILDGVAPLIQPGCGGAGTRLPRPLSSSPACCFPSAVNPPLTGAIEPRKPVMSVNCDVILRWSATPEQLTALGGALWRWCNRAAGNSGIYQHLDNQALADLIAGKLPVSNQTPRSDARGVHFRVRDEASDDRQATIDSLRRELPAKGVEDVLVDGTSWNEIN